MLALSELSGTEQTGLSPDYHRMLVSEILRTDRLRIMALIITATMFVAAVTAIYVLSPQTVLQIWHGHFQLAALYLAYAGFVAFEATVLALITRHLRRNRDVPGFRRYLGAFVETSLPSLVLLAQMTYMGPEQALGFVVPMVYFIFIILSTLRLDFWLSAFTGGVAAVELFAIAMFGPLTGVASGGAISGWGYHGVRSAVILLAGLIAGAVGARLRRQFEASVSAAGARDYITDLFGQHVSPQVVEKLLAAGSRTDGDTGDVAVMFVDIRGFTAAARLRTPRDVVKRLDDAFAILVDLVDRHGGIVNKFLGDGFLALFGAPIPDPDAARNAVIAARAMLEAIARDNESHAWPIRIGIGIHYGDVVAGSVGSPHRKEYTVIGDTVNCAARLESLNKEFGSQLLFSDAVRAAAGTEVADAVSLGDVTIRGYDAPMQIWKLA